MKMLMNLQMTHLHSSMKNAIVVCASRRGNTPQTVEAAKKAKECGATVIGLQLEQVHH